MAIGVWLIILYLITLCASRTQEFLMRWVDEASLLN